jgi:hypothetical protein
MRHSISIFRGIAVLTAAVSMASAVQAADLSFSMPTKGVFGFSGYDMAGLDFALASDASSDFDVSGDDEAMTDFDVVTSSTLSARKLQAATAALKSWMHPEVAEAWAAGWRGQNSRITVVDDFRSATRSVGNFGTGNRNLHHGDWTLMQAKMIAPRAATVKHDFTNKRAVGLKGNALDVINLSYGMMGPAGFAGVIWDARENSIISHATTGKAVVVKAAGNDAVAVNTATGAGTFDYLNLDLTGTKAIFVGALSANGTVDQKAVMASYSNFAGADAAVQDRFIVAGVEGHKTGLYGTSFAAPVVSGYAALLGSKFRGAQPNMIADRLIETARTDTILGYDKSIHGMGEASIGRAIAPASIR